MSSGTRVNWRKGFFRVWVLGTVLWIPLSALVVADDLVQANNWQGPRLLTDAEFFALPPVTQPTAQTGTGMFDDIPMATSEGTADNPFEHLIPAAPAGSAGSSIDDILNSVPTTRPPEGRAPALDASDYSQVAAVALIPSLLVLIAGLALGWVYRGFRAS